MSSWNEFQRSHKGQGLSRAEMSRLYRESNPTAGASASASSHQSAPISADAFSSIHVRTSQQRDTTRRPNAWNDFQHALAGRGLSMQEKRQLYYESQGRSVEEPPMTPPYRHENPTRWPPPSAPMRSDTERRTQRSDELQDVSVSETSRQSSNSVQASDLGEDEMEWLAYQAANADKGWSKTRMAAEYRAAKDEASRPKPSARKTGNRKGSRSKPSRSTSVIRENFEYFVDLQEEKPKPARCTANRLGESRSCEPNRGDPELLNYHERVKFMSSLRASCTESDSRSFAIEPDDGVAYINPERVKLTALLSEEVSIDFSRVWAGEVGGKPVALKVLEHTSTIAESTLRHDVAALMRAPNQHIVRSYGYTLVDSSDGSRSLAVVTELMRGGDLRNSLQHEQWSLRQKRDVLLQVLDALVFLHKHNIAHRNVKASAILLSEGWNTAKLGDFGAATFKHRAAADLPTETQKQKSSSQYSGPPYKGINCQLCTFVNPKNSKYCEACSQELASVEIFHANTDIAEWRCIKCTLVNQGSDIVCIACGGSKCATIESSSATALLHSVNHQNVHTGYQAKILHESDWECVKCTLVNEVSSPVCAGCGGSKRASLESYLQENQVVSRKNLSSMAARRCSGVLGAMTRIHFKRADPRKDDIYAFASLVAEVLLGRTDLQTECHDEQSPFNIDATVDGMECPLLRRLLEQGLHADRTARPDATELRTLLLQVFSTLGV